MLTEISKNKTKNFKKTMQIKMTLRFHPDCGQDGKHEEKK
jgi:hypothetical protein